jgi:hypothetical protein
VKEAVAASVLGAAPKEEEAGTAAGLTDDPVAPKENTAAGAGAVVDAGTVPGAAGAPPNWNAGAGMEVGVGAAGLVPKEKAGASVEALGAAEAAGVAEAVGATAPNEKAAPGAAAGLVLAPKEKVGGAVDEAGPAPAAPKLKVGLSPAGGAAVVVAAAPNWKEGAVAGELELYIGGRVVPGVGKLNPGEAAEEAVLPKEKAAGLASVDLAATGAAVAGVDELKL